MPPLDTDRKFNTWNQLPMSNTALRGLGRRRNDRCRVWPESTLWVGTMLALLGLLSLVRPGAKVIRQICLKKQL